MIIWKQLIEKANEESIKNVVFVTDDAKEDWWYKINSNGKKVVGPLAELQAEIYSESNIDAFQMYSTSMFMSDGESYKAVKVEESSILDAQTSHISAKQRSQINPWGHQNKRYKAIFDSQIKNSQKYRKLYEDSKLTIDLDHFNSLNKSNEQLAKQFEKYDALSKNISLHDYNEALKKYDLINRFNNSSDEEDLIDNDGNE